jgi:lysophospholipase L1-like esterase
VTHRRKALFAVLATLCVLLVSEVLFRAWVGLVDTSLGERIATHRDFHAPMGDLPNILYEPHPYYVYTARTGQPGVNSWGFHFEELPLEKPPGTTRIICLGGSTTAGPKAWPYHLEQILNERYPGPIEVLNFGTGGWTSQESTAAFTLLGQSFDPDLVVVHHANNDIDPQLRADFRPDYAHYRKPISISRNDMGVLRLELEIKYRLDSFFVRWSSLYGYIRLWLVGDQGTVYTLDTLSTISVGDTLPDEGQNAGAFERNLETIGTLIRASGGEVVLTTIPHVESHQPGWGQQVDRQNQRVIALARRNQWPSLALHDMEWEAAWFEDPIHLNQDGEKVKAERVADMVGPMLFERRPR